MKIVASCSTKNRVGLLDTNVLVSTMKVSPLGGFGWKHLKWCYVTNISGMAQLESGYLITKLGGCNNDSYGYKVVKLGNALIFQLCISMYAVPTLKLHNLRMHKYPGKHLYSNLQ